jgi:two-component system response regulator YesN
MLKVLIVEDEDIIRKGLNYMVDWLKVNCIVVGEAVNGIDGLNKIKELEPDIVITDIRMPFKDGIQMLEESIGEYKYEAIIISGYGEFEYAKKAISLGVNEYLLKPINFDHLYEVLNRLSSKIKTKNKFEDYIETINNINLYQEILDINHYNRIENKTDYVINMIDYIKDNYDKRISLTDLSEEYDVSTVYLNSKFKEETSYTFNDFLNRYRILKSIEFLKEGDLMIYEIAELVGFQDYKYFSQVFKKYVGSSPTDFMNSI